MLAHSVAAALAGGCIDSLAVVVVAVLAVVVAAALAVLAAGLAADLGFLVASHCQLARLVCA